MKNKKYEDIKHILLNMSYTQLHVDCDYSTYKLIKEVSKELSDSETVYYVQAYHRGKIIISKEHKETFEQRMWVMAAIVGAIAVTVGFIIGNLV